MSVTQKTHRNCICNNTWQNELTISYVITNKNYKTNEVKIVNTKNTTFNRIYITAKIWEMQNSLYKYL